jgi:hypothetical protein
MVKFNCHRNDTSYDISQRSQWKIICGKKNWLTVCFHQQIRSRNFLISAESTGVTLWYWYERNEWSWNHLIRPMMLYFVVWHVLCDWNIRDLIRLNSHFEYVKVSNKRLDVRWREFSSSHTAKRINNSKLICDFLQLILLIELSLVDEFVEVR